MYLYSALFVVPHTQGAQAWITQCYLQLHQCLPLPCLPRLRLRISNCSLLLIYLPRKDERLSRPGWLTYVRFTHISGHPSAAGRAQDRESSLVKDRRSTNCATQPTILMILNDLHSVWILQSPMILIDLQGHLAISVWKAYFCASLAESSGDLTKDDAADDLEWPLKVI